MAEVGEVQTQLGKLMRFADGMPVNINVNFDPITGQKREFTQSYTPRLGIDKDPPLFTPILIPLGRTADYFMVTRPDRGQEKPDSVYVKRITKERFDSLKRKSDAITPENLDQLKVR